MHDKKQNDKAPFAIEILAKLCNEAISRHGPDRKAIEKYVADNIGALSAADRFRLSSEIEDILKFVPPSPPQRARH